MKKKIMLSIALFAAMQITAGNYTIAGEPDQHSSSDDGIKGKIMINAGLGVNLLSASLQIRYGLSDFWQSYTQAIKGSETPMFNVGVDYGLAKRFSAGASFGYQTAKVFIYPSNVYSSMHYTDSWSRIHFAARGDYYILVKEKLNLYTGIKIGYNAYSMTSNATGDYPAYYSQLHVAPSEISTQGHFGINYYFNNVIGFNVEAAIGVGNPYFLAVGLSIKI